MKNKLTTMEIPESEIEFIHNAKNNKEKDAIFDKVRKGEIRVLLGSTQKMGAGTNCQDRLIAIHDLDVPWRPADLEQRARRDLRPLLRGEMRARRALRRRMLQVIMA